MKRRLYYAAILMAVVLLAAGSLTAYWRLERFLIADARFVMAPPPEYGEASPSLFIQGIEHVSRGRVRNVFREDFGRSVYLLSLTERRRALLDIDWVKEASVSRAWPNIIQVKIVERKPVAFVPLPSAPDAAASFALIDEEGVILRPRTPARFALPVLVGIRRARKRPCGGIVCTACCVYWRNWDRWAKEFPKCTSAIPRIYRSWNRSTGRPWR